MIQTICYFVFFAQQAYLVIRYEPITTGNAEKYRAASIMQVLTFVSLVGSCLPFEKFIIPVLLTYSSSYWIVYFKTVEKDFLM